MLVREKLQVLQVRESGDSSTRGGTGRCTRRGGVAARETVHPEKARGEE